MYTKNITVPAASTADIEKFHRENPIFNTIGVEVSVENVTAYFAVQKVNETLPSHETVTKVSNANHNSDRTVSFDVRILD